MKNSTNWRQIGPITTTGKDVQGYAKLKRRSQQGRMSGYSGIVTEAVATSTTIDVIRCLAATTGNISLSGSQTVDGSVPPAESYVLVWRQTTTSQNGIYRVLASTWERVYSESQLAGALVRILTGTSNGGRWFGTIDGITWHYLINESEFDSHVQTKASTSTLGHVRVDGVSIAIDGSGTISTPADTTNQRVIVSSGGTDIGTRRRINFTASGTASLTVTDNPGSNRVDVAIAGTGPAGSGMANRIAVWSDAATLDAGTILYDAADAVWSIPWQSGDTKPTLLVGSLDASNDLDAIQAKSYSGSAVLGSTTNGVGIKGITTAGMAGMFTATSGVGVTVTTTTGNGIVLTTGGGSNVGLMISQGSSTQPAILVTTGGSGGAINAQSSGSAATIFTTNAGAGPCIEGYRETTGYHAIQGRINAASSTKAGVFGWSNGASGGSGVYGLQQGGGYAVHAAVDATSNAAPALYVTHNGATGSIGGHIVVTGSGRAAVVEINNSSNIRTALEVSTNGTGGAIYSSVSGSGTTLTAVTTGTGRAAFFANSGASGSLPAVEISQTNSAPGLLATATGSGGVAEFSLANSSSSAHAVVISNTGTGRGIDVTSVGIGIAISTSGSSTALSAFSTSTARAGFFARNQSSATLPIVEATQVHASSTAHTFLGTQNGTGAGAYLEATGTGNALILVYSGSTTSSTTANNLLIGFNGTNRVARIDRTGKGFFNGGTQASGADFAELMDVEGVPGDYSPGDVLVISVTADRRVKKSDTAVQMGLAGVYSTFPGFIGSEYGPDEAALALMIPVAFVGIVPVKVTNEGGPIGRGDILVTSSTPGKAKRAGGSPDPLTIVGRALEPMTGASGTIRVRITML